MNPIGRMLARAVTTYKRTPTDVSLPSWLSAYHRVGRYIVTGKV